MLGFKSLKSAVATLSGVEMLDEHRELIDGIKAQDAEGEARAIGRHVEGSGRHIMERMRFERRSTS
jgi:DNA-binding GntR family transcriptional regulator